MDEKNLKAIAAKYDSEDVGSFIRDMGWQDWMADILETKGIPCDDGNLNDVQIAAIDSYLSSLFDEAHS